MADRFRTLGCRIRAARLANGFTHDEIALQVGVTRNSVSMWENGSIKNPQKIKLQRFAKITKVQLGWLMAREGADPDWPEKKPRQKIKTHLSETSVGQFIPEIDLQEDREDGWREASRVGWAIPSDILQLSFNSQPASAVIVLATFDMGPIKARDFLLVDQSRTNFELDGIYFVTLANTIKHVRVERANDGRATVVSGDGKKLKASGLKILGRVSAIIHSV